VSNRLSLIFIKAIKCLSLAIGTTALGGCAIGVGLIFHALISAVSFSPEVEDILFGYSMIGFALVETFAVLALAVLGLIYVL